MKSNPFIGVVRDTSPAVESTGIVNRASRTVDLCRKFEEMSENGDIDTMTVTNLCEKYGVSERSMRRWKRREGLPMGWTMYLLLKDPDCKPGNLGLMTQRYGIGKETFRAAMIELGHATKRVMTPREKKLRAEARKKPFVQSEVSKLMARWGV